MPYLGTIGLEFEQAIAICGISTLEFLKNESLSQIVTFGIESAFSKGPGSSFPEGLGSRPGPL